MYILTNLISTALVINTFAIIIQNAHFSHAKFKKYMNIIYINKNKILSLMNILFFYKFIIIKIK